MKLQRVIFKGLTRYNEEVDLDLSTLPEGLIAVVAENGAGKSSLLAAMGPLALYRMMPDRVPHDANNWFSDGGYLEHWHEAGGSQWRIRHDFSRDPPVPALLERDGEPVTSGGIKPFNAEIRRLYGPPEAFLASSYAAQGHEARFGQSDPKDRRAVLRHYLLLDRLEAVRQQASQEAQLVEASLSGRDAPSDLRKAEQRLQAAREELPQREADVLAEQAALNVAAREVDALAHLEALVGPADAYRRALKEAVDLEKAARIAEGKVQPGDDPDDLRQLLEEITIWEAQDARLERALKDAQHLEAAAQKQLVQAQRQAGVLQEVPCRGQARYAGCPLLSQAQEAHVNLPVLTETERQAGAVAVEAKGAFAVHAWDGAGTPNKPQVQARFRVAVDAVYRRQEADKARVRAKDLRATLGPTLPDQAALDALKAARQESAAARQALDAAKQGLWEAAERARNQESRVAELQEQVATDSTARRQLAALNLLAKGLGPHGAQALEVDAAGPQVSNLANELLEACWGDRFKVQLRTQRPMKSGGYEETCYLEVADSHRARTGRLESYSGGERVILDEAVANALALLGLQRRSSPLACLTAWRDEVPAQLYGDAVARHAAMLRRACQVGGLHRVFHVGGKEAADAADAVLLVTPEGRVERTK